MVTIGIDTHTATLAASAIDAAGRELAARTFGNDRRGHRSLLRWAQALDPHWLEGELTWFSGAAQKEITRPAWIQVTHFFNHQTHHRGQVHCMITQCGIRPSDTDLMILPASA